MRIDVKVKLGSPEMPLKLRLWKLRWNFLFSFYTTKQALSFRGISGIRRIFTSLDLWTYSFKWPSPSSLQQTYLGGFQQLAIQTLYRQDLADTLFDPPEKLFELQNIRKKCYI